MAAHQAQPSLGFSRQEHQSGLPFPPPMHESESEVVQSCPTLSDRMDCSPPGSSIHGIFQARVLEWGALAFSIQTFMLLLLLLSHFIRVWLCATPSMAAHQAPPSLGFSRQEYWSGLPLPSPKDRLESSNLPFSIQWKNLKNKDPLTKKLIMFYGEATSWILVTKDRVI